MESNSSIVTPVRPAITTVTGSTTSVRQHLARLLGWSIGIGTHLLFAFTVWHLFFFLRDGRPAPESPGPFVVVDGLLSLAFVIPHSLLLWPPCSQRLKRWIRAEFYGCLYCVVTCVSLLVLFHNWRGASGVVWDLQGTARRFVQGAFVFSWVALFYSLHLTGLGYQTGLTQWWHWVQRRRLPRREFHARGIYRVMRHPVYLSFLGLIWFTPRMSYDHAILTGIWTVYIFLGSYLKDERLEFYLGDSYRQYRQKVPGYFRFW